ncbi:sterol carrier family protein [uncultured Corynebacterium sp.]|uniref:sterol carrier family protein n=1 Tax=uncultured Corynebacterium sp. TaxID=159447 RepID=UPI002592C217|nr:sterol carrier family protein [uncultured Corynebacterium sp.]
MKKGKTGPELSAAAREAVNEVLEWVVQPDAPRPPRASVAAAVRLSVQVLGDIAPGHSVEVRVPPFAAVQCVAGPEHRRGTPPNVVECEPREWLRLAVGEVSLSVANTDLSGTRAHEVQKYLPLFRFAR